MSKDIVAISQECCDPALSGISPWEALANAIIIQAVRDYRTYAMGYGEFAESQRRLILKFFRSEYFAKLTSVDPEVLIHMLGAEENKNKRKRKKVADRVDEGCYSVKQAAELAGIRADKIYRAIRERRLRAHKINGIYQILREDLEKFKNQRKRGGAN